MSWLPTRRSPPTRRCPSSSRLRYHGEIGFAETRETSPGIWKKIITPRRYRGTVTTASRRFRDTETVNGVLKTNTVISIVGDAYAFEHLFAMRWCQWAGALWTISYADFKRPRIVLTLGELYNVQNGR